MDLETMTITLSPENHSVKNTFIKTYGGQCEKEPYGRIVSREPNEEGQWIRLINELEEISQQYGISLDETLNVFESVSCDK